MIKNRVIATVSVILLIDQISKIYVVQYLNLKEKLSIDVISPVLNFKMAWNQGINFGLFDSGGELSRLILITLSLIISVALLWWIRKSNNAWRQSCVSLIVGGALGNMTDRIVFGAVADFLNMSCCGVQNPFSFNVADIAIFFGAFGLIIWDKNENLIT